MLTINFSYSDNVESQIISTYYQVGTLEQVLGSALQIMLKKYCDGLIFPYFTNTLNTNFKDKTFELDIYITDVIEAKSLNLDARGKDYATNILSYPSDLPASMISILPSVLLGELIICHEVINIQAQEQEKSVTNHLTHLLIHGLLHLLGFDHELGEHERLTMESFEIDILNGMAIKNPYL